MKITSLMAAADSRSILEVKKIVNEALTELGTEIEEINLFFNALPVFDGIKSDLMKPIENSLRSSEGVIIYTNSYFSMPGSLIEILFEHMSADHYKDILRGKNCFLIVNAKKGDPKRAVNILSEALNDAGAFDSVRLAIDESFISAMAKDDEKRLMVERSIDDFYRMLRQQRRHYIPKSPIAFENPMPFNEIPAQKPIEKNNDNTYENLIINTPLEPAPKEIKAPDIAKPEPEKSALSILDDKFSEAQQKDIQEITKFFAEKFKEPEKEEIIPTIEPILPELPKTVSKKTCRQLSQSLIHYFKSSKSADLDMIFQINITGEEEFDGYYEIGNHSCQYVEGIHSEPSITVISSAKAWQDILKGKLSSQKSFMTGQIKVRGNFVLLSKFDQAFDFGKN